MTHETQYPAVLAMLKHEHPDAVAEHRWHPHRQWRFDFAIPSAKVAIEIDGGCWTGGRHSRGKGMIGDMEKMNTAAIFGWRVLRFTPQQLGSIRAAVWSCVYYKGNP